MPEIRVGHNCTTNPPGPEAGGIRSSGRNRQLGPRRSNRSGFDSGGDGDGHAGSGFALSEADGSPGAAPPASRDNDKDEARAEDRVGFYRCSRSAESCGKFVLAHKRWFVAGVLLFLAADALLLGLLLSRPASQSAKSASPSPSPSPSPPGQHPHPNHEPDPVSPSEFLPGNGQNQTADSEAYRIDKTRTGRFELLEVVPHDSNAFTQGLEILSVAKIELMERYRQQPQQQPQQQDSPAGETPQWPGRNDTNTNIAGGLPLATFPNASAGPLSAASPEGYVLESTGQYGASTLRIVELGTGKVVDELELGDEVFGEGCTYYYHDHGPALSPGEEEGERNGVVRVVQITWTSGRGYVYERPVPSGSETWGDAPGLARVGEFRFSSETTSGEGWGIAYLPARNQFVVSDGTEYLHFWELTETEATGSSNDRSFAFDLADRVAVRELRREEDPPGDSPGDARWTRVDDLNELEWDPYSYGGNTILANVWQTTEVLRIWVGAGDPRLIAGTVSHAYDLSDLEDRADPRRRGAVLNGIAVAYGSSPARSAGGFWVTGKYWPEMYRIRLLDGG